MRKYISLNKSKESKIGYKHRARAIEFVILTGIMKSNMVGAWSLLPILDSFSPSPKVMRDPSVAFLSAVALAKVEAKGGS